MIAADKFRRIRRETGLSQVDFAVAIGCSRAHVARVENGKAEYRYGELQAIVKLTGLQPGIALEPQVATIPWMARYQQLTAKQRQQVDQIVTAALGLTSV